MPTLTSSWQELSRDSWYSGYGYEYCIMFACANEDVAANKSTVHTLLRISTDPYAVTVDSWSAGLDGTNGTTGGRTTFDGDTNILEGYYDVGHNADGTGGVTIHGAFNATFGLTSSSPGVYCTLQTIPRASQPSVSGSCPINGSSGITIYTNRASSSFTHTITYSFGSKSGTITTNAGASCYWVPSLDLITEIAQSDSGSGTITCKTNGVGTKTCGFTLTNPGSTEITIQNNSISLASGQNINYNLHKPSGLRTVVNLQIASVNSNLNDSWDSVGSGFGIMSYESQILAATSGSISITGKLTVTTYYGGTKIRGSQSTNFYVSIPSSYGPTISNFGIAETALSSYGVTGNDIIRYISKKKITASVAAKGNASITSVSCSCGSANASMSLASGAYSGSLEYLDNKNIVVSAKDSRGFTASYTYSNGIYYEYSYPSIQSGSLKREISVSSTGYLKCKGTYWNGTVENITNAPTWKYKLQPATSYTVANILFSNGVWNNKDGEVKFTTLNYQQAFKVDVIVEDSFGKSASTTYTLPSAQYTVWMGKDTFRIKDNLIAKKVITDELQLSNAKEYRYTVEGANGTVKWVKLGTWSETYDSMNAIIHIYSSSGYNGNASQNGEIEVYIKDGWQSDTSTANSAFGVSCLFSHTKFGQTIQARATSHNSIDIWLYTASTYWNFTCSVYVSDGIWTPKSELMDSEPTAGVSQECVGKQICTRSDLLDWEHPVGSVVIFSEYSYSPAIIFGGSWSRIDAGYLYSENRNAGQTRFGSWTTGSTAITVAQMPSHTHAMAKGYYSTALGEGGRWCVTADQNYPNDSAPNDKIPYVGGNQGHTHSIEPPGQRVYAWKRVS
jgi:hypothetical protein